MLTGGRPRLVGFVGVGNMGRRMAANLAAAGFSLVIRDSDAGAQQRFTDEHGGEPATSPGAFADADVVVTMLPDGNAVREAMLGWAGGIAAALNPGAVVLDMSSSDPIHTKALAQDLATGRSFSTEVVLTQEVITGRYGSGFALGLLAKDVGIAADLADAVGVEAPACQLVRRRLADAAAGLGSAADHSEAHKQWWPTDLATDAPE